MLMQDIGFNRKVIVSDKMPEMSMWVLKMPLIASAHFCKALSPLLCQTNKLASVHRCFIGVSCALLHVR